MQITFVRHGETIMNERNICQSADEPLSALGRLHAQQAGNALRDQHFDIAYVSSMQRAIETADEILQHHPITERIVEPAIREYENGDWVGRQTGWRAAERIRIAAEQNIERWQVRAPNGESMEDTRRRIVSFMLSLRSTHHASVLIISHASASMYMLHFLIGFNLADSREFHLKPGGYTTIKVEGNSTEILANNIGNHLT